MPLPKPLPLLKVSNLTYKYGKTTAVDNISFTLQRGQVLGFLGPNGAGKSTTMKMISGVHHASQGSISVNGFTIEEQPKKAKQHIGFLPENPPVYPDLTVYEYLQFCAQLNLIAKTSIKQAINTALDDCDLHDVSNKLIGQLSKGYQQRVGIAQAIIHRPDIIILDEPTVGLDPIQVSNIRALIKKLAKNHAIILSTHILQEVTAVCTDVQIINKGQLVYTNSMANLQQSEKTTYQIETNASFDIEQLQNLKGIKSINPVQSLETIFLDKINHV